MPSAEAWLKALAPAVLLLLCVGEPSKAQSTPLGAARDHGAIFDGAARTAWRFVEANTHPVTGLVSATPHYHNATTWDLASGLAAVYSAWRLGLIDPADYRARMDRMLESIEDLPLYDGAVYHKVYSVRTGRMVDGDGIQSSRGYAWSATDLGRFLVWLAILERNDSAAAPAVRRIAQRMDYDRIVRDGYLYGEDANRRTPSFQEGRIGYEQYAATGFDLWDQPVDRALDLLGHADTVEVWGQQILRDGRGMDRIASEPFVMMGLELGLDGDMRRLAEAVLALQRERHARTGIVTIASEDAVDVPPHYFYYYCVYCSGELFVVETHTPGHRLAGPRWVSTKNAFGWHALMPDDYTELAVHTVRAAETSAGWQSGVFEESERATGTVDVNTAAVVLEAALYARLGRPLIESSN